MNITMPRLIAAYIAGPAVAVGLTMAAVVGIPAVANAGAEHGNPEPIVLMEMTSDDRNANVPMDKLVADLKARGWTADPGDGYECLYVGRDRQSGGCESRRVRVHQPGVDFL